MKKVLLATSFLVATTGFAAAEVAVSGSARMGVVYDSTLDAGSGKAYFSSRVRIVFTASGETDGGLAFGASMRADQQGGNNNDGGVITPAIPDDLTTPLVDESVAAVKVDKDGDSNGDSTVFLSGDFGKITMGDVSGAADALVGQTSGVGYGPNDGLQEIDFIGTDKTAAYYEYSTGNFTVGLGVGQIWDVDADVALGETANIAVKYAMGDYTAAIGYETSDTEDLISASGSAKFGAFTLKARVSDSDIAGVDTPYSVSGDYVTGALTITAFYTDFGNYNGVSDDTQHVGLGASYDLGGGAKLAGGIVQQMNGDVLGVAVGDETFADVGVKFSF